MRPAPCPAPGRTRTRHPPGAFAATDEIVALAKIVKAKGGRYFTHLRDESNKVIEALQEAIDVA